MFESCHPDSMKQEKTFDAVKYIDSLIKRTREGELTWRSVSWATTAGEQDGSKTHVVHGYRTTDKGRRLDIGLDPVGHKYYTLSVSVDKIEDEAQRDPTQGWASTGITGGAPTELYNAIVGVKYAELMEDIEDTDDADTAPEEPKPEEGETPYKDRPDITTRQLRRALWVILSCTFLIGVLCGHFLWR